MKVLLIKKFIPLALLLLFPLSCQKSSTSEYQKTLEPLIRVLITQDSKEDKKVASVGTTGNCSVITAEGKVLLKGKILTTRKVYVSQGSIFFGKKNLKTSKVTIEVSPTSFTQVNERQYSGKIHFQISTGNQFRIINELPMERYIGCVLGGEMPLHWEDAALSAQAIIARTYALYERRNNKEIDFDVYDSVRSQVYQGAIKETPRSREIIEMTRGLVLTYQNDLFKTFFHSTCGGHTANAKNVFDYDDITPLAGRPCQFCSEGKYYKWQHLVHLSELEMILQEMGIQSFAGIARGMEEQYPGEEFGRLLTMVVYYNNQQKKVDVSAQKIRLRLGGSKVRSTFFKMEQATDGVLMQGRGWGHGVGMCQVGAQTMAEKKDFRSTDINVLLSWIRNLPIMGIMFAK